jgi:hypothetical protein
MEIDVLIENHQKRKEEEEDGTWENSSANPAHTTIL